jgi:hypothetical protein
VKIPEVGLSYSPEAPLRAWRLFRIRPSGDGFVLSAPMYHDPEHPLWPDAVHEASCTEGHPAPAPGCRCGIYGAVSGTVDSLPGYLLDTSYETDPWVYAEIGCSGRVFVDMRGVRAERGEILRIALLDAEQTAEVRESLAQHYGVPVVGGDQVPDWVTQNVRRAGPPPKEANLNLDISALELCSEPLDR